MKEWIKKLKDEIRMGIYSAVNETNVLNLIAEIERLEKEYQETRYYHLAKLQHRNKQLEAVRDKMKKLLTEALEEWQYNSTYKSDYLRDKHRDLERIAEIKQALAACGEAR